MLAAVRPPRQAHRPALPGWFLGVQWHPEDTAAVNPMQQNLFDALVGHARS